MKNHYFCAGTGVGSAEQMVANLDRYQGTSETEIQIRLGQAMLSKSAKDALDQMAAPLKGQRSYIVEVRGLSPGYVQTAIANSRKMADSVVRYLVLTHKVPLYRIYVTSMGNAAAIGGEKKASGARVEVSVLRNGPVASTRIDAKHRKASSASPRARLLHCGSVRLGHAQSFVITITDQ